MELQYNWFAVFVTASFGMIIPAIWYAPKLFGRAWMELNGFQEEGFKQPGATYALAALLSLLTSFAMAGFLNYLGSVTFLQGAAAGAQFWLGFVLTQLLVDYRFSKKSWKFAAINLGHSLITFALTGGVLAAWR